MGICKLLIILIFLAVLFSSCTMMPFNQEFGEGFVRGPLMTVASYPEGAIPDLSWANHSMESRLFSLSASGGGMSSGGGGCPS